MKVLFDLSVLGAAEYAHQRGTRGIVRVAEHLVNALVHAPDVDLSFTAAHNRAAARRYFHTRLASSSTGNARARGRFAEPALPGRPLREAVTAAEDFLAARYVHPPWKWLGAARAARYAAYRLLDRGVEPGVARGLEIYHSPFDGLPRWVRRQAGVRRFLTVHDLGPLRHPEYFLPGAPRLLRRALDSLAPDDWAVCDSAATRQDLLGFYPQRDPARTLVNSLAAEACFHPVTEPLELERVRGRYGIPPGAPYFLSVSTIEPRKNFETVIRAFGEFCRAAPSQPAFLVLVGDAGWQTHPLLATLAGQEAGLRARIITTGYVADADLAALYSGAMAFVYLSFFEGFGLPVLEAMQCGVPVVASDRSSLPEVIGDAGLLVAPTDAQAVGAHLLRLVQDSRQRASWRERGLARARQFTWSGFEARSLAAYRQALARE